MQYRYNLPYLPEDRGGYRIVGHSPPSLSTAVALETTTCQVLRAMAVTLHALEAESPYARLRFCACCPLIPAKHGGDPPGGAHLVGGTRARLQRVLSHVGDEWSSSTAPSAGRLRHSLGAAMDIPWCRDVRAVTFSFLCNYSRNTGL
eukprot:SAG31_NODE_2313_length_5956_cov_3.390302_7_plen_147_part_00